MEDNTPSPDGQAQGGSPETKDPSSLEAELTQLRQRLEFLQTESKEAFKARDEVKAKLKALEEAEEMKKGNYEKLLSEKSTELEGLKAEADRLRAVEEQFNKFQSSLKDELLSQLPEDHKTIAGKLAIDDLREYVKLHKTASPAGMEGSRAGGSAKVDVTGREWDDFTIEELRQIRNSNKAAYSELYKKKYGQRPN